MGRARSVGSRAAGNKGQALALDPFSLSSLPLCMTSPDSSSTVDSLRVGVAMDFDLASSQLPSSREDEDEENPAGRHYSSHKRRAPPDEATGGADEEEEEAGPAMWDAFSTRFREVQSLLDQNRVLIAQVNENHRSKIPDNLTKNVALIREINVNISKIVALYSDISLHFSNHFDDRRQARARAPAPAGGSQNSKKA